MFHIHPYLTTCRNIVGMLSRPIGYADKIVDALFAKHSFARLLLVQLLGLVAGMFGEQLIKRQQWPQQPSAQPA